MQNYHFDETNWQKPFTTVTEAGKGTMPPANALRIEPNFKVGYWPCAAGDEWVQVVDHRCKTIYSTENPQEIELVQTVGEIKDGYTLLKPLSMWAVWNGESWAEKNPT